MPLVGVPFFVGLGNIFGILPVFWAIPFAQVRSKSDVEIVCDGFIGIGNEKTDILLHPYTKAYKTILSRGG